LKKRDGPATVKHNDLRVSAFGTKNRTTPRSTASVDTSTSSSLSFLSVTEGRESPMSRGPTVGSASASAPDPLAAASASAGVEIEVST
jgi:hypothetical protein